MNIYDFTPQHAVQILFKQGIFAQIKNEKIVLVFNDSNTQQKAQQIIDSAYFNMPDLLPVQFHFMLNKYGFDDVIAILLPALKSENLDKYAMYKAYLEQARFYEFRKAYPMFVEIQEKFTAIDSNFSFSLEQLKAMWLDAYKV